MNTTYTQQIEAIQKAVNLINGLYMHESVKQRVLPGLNDAGSTIAALNLTKDLLTNKEIQLIEFLARMNRCLEDGLTIEKGDPFHQKIVELVK